MNCATALATVSATWLDTRCATVAATEGEPKPELQIEAVFPHPSHDDARQ